MSTDLPTEIITSILSRLPVKSLVRFRCVSKPWCSLIKNPNFIKLHLDHGIKTNVPNVILRFHDLFTIEPDSDSQFHEAKEIDYPYETPYYGVEILGSCNGLLYIRPDEDVYCIWNPSTQEFKKLPNTPIDAEAEDESIIFVQKIYHGFGYDDSSNDYKVVRIVSFYCETGELKSEVKVYTLGTNSWRRVEDVPHDVIHHRSSGVLLNGCLHWVALQRPLDCGSSKKIISFNLAEERFKVVPQHDCQDDDMKLEALGGCLCVVSKFSSSQLQVWVMTDYGKKESWTKLFSFADPFSIQSFEYLKPSCKFYLEMDKKHIVLYNLNSEKIKTLHVPGPWRLSESETYVQSLVSLNTGTYVWDIQAKGTTRKRKNMCEKKKRRTTELNTRNRSHDQRSCSGVSSWVASGIIITSSFVLGECKNIYRLISASGNQSQPRNVRIQMPVNIEQHQPLPMSSKAI